MAHAARPRPASTRLAADLIQHTEEVLRDAEEHPVTLLREDQEPLVLMSQHELEARDVLLDLAGKIVTAALDAPSLESRARQGVSMDERTVSGGPGALHDRADRGRARRAQLGTTDSCRGRSQLLARER